MQASRVAGRQLDNRPQGRRPALAGDRQPSLKRQPQVADSLARRLHEVDLLAVGAAEVEHEAVARQPLVAAAVDPQRLVHPLAQVGADATRQADHG